MGGRSSKRWTETEDAILHACYANTPTPVLLLQLHGRSEEAIKQRAAAKGIRKSAEARSEALRQGNEKSRAQGNRRSELVRRPIGATHDKGRYILIKVAQPDVWKPLHIHVWEQANGPVPDGKIVAAKDGSTRNTDISNLCLRTRSEHQLRRHSSHRHLPDEIVDILHLQHELKKEIKRKTKHEK
jgi:hypothetical protein